jgi:hypothetical protein
MFGPRKNWQPCFQRFFICPNKSSHLVPRCRHNQGDRIWTEFRPFGAIFENLGRISEKICYSTYVPNLNKIWAGQLFGQIFVGRWAIFSRTTSGRPGPPSIQWKPPLKDTFIFDPFRCAPLAVPASSGSASFRRCCENFANVPSGTQTSKLSCKILTYVPPHN